jgi:hypothetical protein
MVTVATLVLWLPDLYILHNGKPAKAVDVLMVMHLATLTGRHCSRERAQTPRAVWLNRTVSAQTRPITVVAAPSGLSAQVAQGRFAGLAAMEGSTLSSRSVTAGSARR